MIYYHIVLFLPKGKYMAVCTICGKGTMAGRNIRHKHSGLWERKAPATVRTFQPNIQKRSVIVDGERVRLQFCTKCLKRVRKEPGWRGIRLPVYTAHEQQAGVQSR